MDVSIPPPPASAQAPVLWEPRYAMLDAWRGVAALGVAASHLGLRVGFDLSQACIMAFFVISGYCIAATTESCTRSKLGPRVYLWRRLRRIYPPYFFAICFFVATRLVKLAAGMGNDLSASVSAWVQNLTMTQWLSLLWQPRSMPVGNPTLFVAGFWSLNYEEQFYLVMGLLMLAGLRFRVDMLAGVLGLMVCGFVWNFLYPSTSFGFFLEYWIPFAVGVLVFYRLCRFTGRVRLIIDAGLALLLAFAIYEYFATPPLRIRPIHFEWMTATAFAFILIVFRSWDTLFKNSAAGAALAAFGLISYSLYLTHQCNLEASRMVAQQFLHLGLWPESVLPIRLAFVCAMATLFWYFCERPFRNAPIAPPQPARPRGLVTSA